MDERKKAMVMASFAADALALGVHWIYNTKQIAASYGRVESFVRPAPDSYHPTKDKGDLTHYGDQTFVLLQSLAAKKAFDLQDFSDRWRKLFENYKGYIDGATRKTLAWYAKGKTAENAGSHTGDFSGASRIAPILYLYNQDEEKTVTTARAQTAMTHNDPHTVDTAEFFARVIFLIFKGAKPVEAVEQIVSMEPFEMSAISMWVSDGLKSIDQESVSAISRFGQACETTQVFPGVIHLISKYEDNLKEALIQAVMAGGDSAARGSMVGMVLAAHLGMESIPEQWLAEMNKRKDIEELLERIA